MSREILLKFNSFILKSFEVKINYCVSSSQSINYPFYAYSITDINSQIPI